jgi:predicted nucleic acid-binding protein
MTDNRTPAARAASERLTSLLDDESAVVPVKPTALADLLEVASDEQRLALFGRLQSQVGRGRVNDVWFAATAIEEERAQ